jgi:hypothetical protein
VDLGSRPHEHRDVSAVAGSGAREIVLRENRRYYLNLAVIVLRGVRFTRDIMGWGKRAGKSPNTKNSRRYDEGRYIFSHIND